MRFSLVEFSLVLVLVVEIYKYRTFLFLGFFFLFIRTDAFLVATTRLLNVCFCLLFTLVEL